jgi:hypothetical protein
MSRGRGLEAGVDHYYIWVSAHYIVSFHTIKLKRQNPTNERKRGEKLINNLQRKTHLLIFPLFSEGTGFSKSHTSHYTIFITQSIRRISRRQHSKAPLQLLPIPTRRSPTPKPATSQPFYNQSSQATQILLSHIAHIGLEAFEV